MGGASSSSSSTAYNPKVNARQQQQSNKNNQHLHNSSNRKPSLSIDSNSANEDNKSDYKLVIPTSISSPMKSSSSPHSPPPSSSSSPAPPPTKPSSFFPSFFRGGSSSNNNLYLTKDEEHLIASRMLVRNKSILYVMEYIYYGVPVKTKGTNTPHSPNKGSGLANDPDLVIMSIDADEILKQLVNNSGAGGKEAKRMSIDLKKEYSSYPESCVVDKYGDIFVSMDDAKSIEKRKISGIALNNLKFIPNTPDPPFIVGVTSASITIGWNATDEGTGLIDRYYVEYTELGVSNNSGYRALVTVNWARDDDLLYVLEGINPNSSFKFRIKCRNKLGWSDLSGDSLIGVTDAAPPNTPQKCFCTKVTSDSVHLHWHPPRDNGSVITKYQLRGKKVGGIFTTIYEGRDYKFLYCEVEAGVDYIFECKAINSCGKSSWSPSFTCPVPLITSNNKKLQNELNANLRKGHLWIECWDPKDDRVFYFHTITTKRELVAPPEFVQWRKEQNDSKNKNQEMEIEDPVKKFRMKRFRFFQTVRKRNGAGGKGETKVFEVNIRRPYLFTDTYNLFGKFQKSNLVKKFKIVFTGEEGIDSGGLTKDWYLGLSRALGVEKLKIFKASSAGGFEIHQESGTSEVALQKFKFAGMVIGKALFDRQFLDMPLSKTMYKLILGLEVGLNDLEEIDATMYKSLGWMMENSVAGILFETFSVEMEETLEDGKSKKKVRVALCEDGENREVDDENKGEYIKLMAEWRVKWSVNTQLEAFMKGLHILVGKDLLAEFSIVELELLFNGKKHIDVDEIRAYTIYQGDIKADSKLCTWFWQLITEMDMEKRMRLLKFCTGSDRVPLDGFDPPFNLTFGSDMDCEDLVRSHTCFNQIVIPGYKSFRVMREKIVFAIENCEEFVLR